MSSKESEILGIVIETSKRLGIFEAVQKEQGERQDELTAALENHMKIEESIQGNIQETLSEMKRRIEDIPNETHNQDHEYIKRLQEKEKCQADFWTAVRWKVVSGGALALFMGIASALLFAGKVYFGGEITADDIPK